MKTQAYPLLLATLLLAPLSSCSDYDLDQKLPPNFGTSLMDYLEENGFENYRQLVKDLGYEEALKGSALKTLFAANDEAFARFYAANPWGVHSYQELTLAQKKLLLYSSMLDNSLQVMNLSSTTGLNGVTEGNAMRRQTAVSVYDSVPVITPAQMPDNGAAWQYYIKNNKSIVCMKDMSSPTMMMLIEQFLLNNKITNEDVNFLFNHTISRQSGDAYINGILVSEGNLRSANGFVHLMSEVMTPLPNMADLLASKPQTQTYSRLIERFSAPYYAGRDVTDNYNYEYGTNVDSVFMKKFYSERSTDGKPCNRLPNDLQAAPALLKFDPGWNAFFSDDPNAISQTVAVQQNMGVMLVPSDEALEKYWNEGTGKVLKDNYGTWDNVPDKVLSKLINNNMLNSWINSVPSKMAEITNSTQDPMGIEPQHVDSVWLGCNGAIYLTNRVFSPTEYVSVSFPALVNESMSIFNWAIEQGQYGSYLNSLDSYYSLFIPTNMAMLEYVDPVSFAETETKLYRFHFREDAESEDDKVWASIYRYDLENRQVGDSIGESRGWDNLGRRLTDILDNHIVVGNIESGKEYYRTKNGGVVRVYSEGGKITGVQSTLQIDQDKIVPVARIYDQSAETNGQGNGKTYIIDEEPLLTTRNSVCDILEQREDCSLFYELLHGSELFEMTRGKDGWKTGSKTGNISSFNNYHYTVYIPTNETLKPYLDKGQIHTWTEISDMLEQTIIDAEEAQKMKDELNAFLRYHFQDNSLYLGMDYQNEGGSDTFTRKYETSVMNSKNKFHTVEVEMKPGSLQVTDEMGNVRHVQTASPADYNRSAREYQISWRLETSAFAVVHIIDGPLFYDATK